VWRAAETGDQASRSKSQPATPRSYQASRNTFQPATPRSDQASSKSQPATPKSSQASRSPFHRSSCPPTPRSYLASRNFRSSGHSSPLNDKFNQVWFLVMYFLIAEC
jgi:hypothetical protein